MVGGMLKSGAEVAAMACAGWLKSGNGGTHREVMEFGGTK